MTGYWDLAITIVIGIAALAWVWWQRRHPRIRGVDAESGRADEQPKSFAQHCDDALDVIAADKDLVMEIVEAFGHEQAKVEHADAAMRRLIGDSPISEDRRADLLGEWHDRLEHTVPWPHLTAEEAADCTRCSPSSLPRRTEGGDGHG